MARNKVPRQVWITVEQREQLDALREQGHVVSELFRRALDTVLASYGQQDVLALADREADAVLADESALPREKALAQNLRFAVLRERRLEEQLRSADERYARSRAVLRGLREQLEEALREP